jgi:hypothetical protein
VQRSSDTIGNLAAALAKAQLELVNPEKSLAATIRSEGGGGAEQTFRYAPLSSGLEIVRKTLGQHEIATVQTTAVDQAAGIINLTTVLAHSSGEWIASDWPVCAITDTATPHRMGAALTYARRYALFTLVGIAGEDDLDAHDVTTPTNSTTGLEKPRPTGIGRLNGGHGPQAQRVNDAKSAKSILRPEASAELRDRLLAELNPLGTGDEMALWAHRCLPEKNSLAQADAERVEEAFQARLATLAPGAADAPRAPEVASGRLQGQNRRGPGRRSVRPRSSAVNKSLLALPEHAVSGTGTMSGLSPSTPVWSAAGNPRTPTTCALPKAEPSAARSATNSPSPSAEGTTVKSTVRAMKPTGGRCSASIRRLSPEHYGSRRIRFPRFKTKPES